MEQDCCRICLSKTQSLERQDLFLNEHSDLSVLGQLYEEVLNIPIANEQITLRYICNSCVLQLKLFKQLKNKAFETYLLLIELLNDIPGKSDDSVKKKNKDNKPYETNNVPLTDTNTLSITEFKEEYFFENEENTSLPEYTHCQDYEQQEKEIVDNEINENESTKNETTEIELTENETNEIELTENETTEIENAIIENEAIRHGITEREISEHYLDANDISKTTKLEREDDLLRQIKDQKDDAEDEIFRIEEFIKNEEDIMLNTSDEEEYEICYLDEEINLENSENEIDETDEFDEECLMDEADTNENNSTSKITESNDVFHCKHCDETFKLKSQFKSHKKKIHSITIKIQCPYCIKTFFSNDTYQAHINVHNGLPAYQCNICEKAFNQKVHYNYHILNHNNERNIICDVCQKRFISKGDLKTHMRCHTDERRYKCDICDKRFRAHTHMVNHRYSHFEKQFECPECLQKYMSPNTLRTHFKAVHNAEVPFECEFCEKRFKRKHHLQAHYKTHAKVLKSISILEE